MVDGVEVQVAVGQVAVVDLAVVDLAVSGQVEQGNKVEVHKPEGVADLMEVVVEAVNRGREMVAKVEQQD